MELKEGDIVCLKSGGPKMTIQDIDEYSFEIRAHCTWFEGTNLKDGYFMLNSLKLAE